MNAKVKEMLEQVRICDQRIKAEQEQMKAIKDAMVEQTGIDKKIVSKLIKVYCSDKGHEELALWEQVRDLMD